MAEYNLDEADEVTHKVGPTTRNQAPATSTLKCRKWPLIVASMILAVVPVVGIQAMFWGCDSTRPSKPKSELRPRDRRAVHGEGLTQYEAKKRTMESKWDHYFSLSEEDQRVSDVLITSNAASIEISEVVGEEVVVATLYYNERQILRETKDSYMLSCVTKFPPDRSPESRESFNERTKTTVSFHDPWEMSEALSKFAEWEHLARENKMLSFNKKFPYGPDRGYPNTFYWSGSSAWISGLECKSKYVPLCLKLLNHSEALKNAWLNASYESEKKTKLLK